MHIPDGYLSPSTCATLYVGAAAGWYASLRRVKHRLNTRAIPLISVFAAFCFVVMMFNVPLPGGTTGHAIGVGVAAIVLGPWESILAISLALTIQALFFGDGGITTLGANCFNMAIVGSFVAWSVYHLVARNSAPSSKRRPLAAAIAGYVAINASALCAAIEFGIQPMLFHDASGTPLYAPYPLHVAIPAMMIGHLTIAGLAEAAISAGMIAYLQRADITLLGGGVGSADIDRETTTAPGNSRGLRRLWWTVALLMLLTPLGILAAGTAWGEWSARDFQNANSRAQIAAASANHSPPAVAPSGLERLASVWTAPFAGYAPSFMKSAAAGYVLSAMFGVGLLLLLSLVTTSLTGRDRHPARQHRFLERTLRGFARAFSKALQSERIAAAPGVMQRLDPRVRLVGVIALVLASVLCRRLEAIAALLLLAIVLALASRVPLRTLFTRVWLVVFGFTGLIALPALFLVPGQTLHSIPMLHLSITEQGLRAAVLLILRVETAVTLTTTLVLSTPWTHVLKALRSLHVPAEIVTMLAMTHRYIFLLAESANQMFESRQSRSVGLLSASDSRAMASRTAGVLFSRSVELSQDVYLAMLSRGFTGEVRLLSQFEMRARDYAAIALFFATACLVVWMGR